MPNTKIPLNNLGAFEPRQPLVDVVKLKASLSP